jgi:rod shape determining protein RodA
LRRLFANFADFVRESDKILLTLCLIAGGYGCMAVFSATNYMESHRAFLVHSFCIVVGFVIVFVASFFEYDRILKYWPIAAVAGIVPVLLTLVIGFAPVGTDDKAWLN